MAIDKSEETLFTDRSRTNILRQWEQALIKALLKITPQFVTPNLMTGLGAIGSVIVLIGFLLGASFSPTYLLLGIVGLFINWVGDSLDGRLAYYRNIPRKWYGFALDILMDWFSIALIAVGYHIYAPTGEIFALLFANGYAWSMLLALLRYKITDRYQIDTGLVGPTELRVIIALILITEVLFRGSIFYAAIGITLVLFTLNFIDTLKLLADGDERDRREKDG